MNALRFLSLCVLLLLVAACSAEEAALPTRAVISEVATSLPTNTPTLQSTATFYPTPTSTSIPTTDTPLPSSTPTPQPTLTPTSPPLPEGNFVFLWSPAPISPYDLGLHNLYTARHDSSVANWNIEPVLANLGAPALFPSPDKTQLVIRTYEDTNGDGSIGFYGPVISDRPNLFLYTLANKSVQRLTEHDKSDWIIVDWLPDRQAIIYNLFTDIFQVNLNQAPSRQHLLLLPEGQHRNHSLSPDGNWLAIFSLSNQFQGTSTPDRLDIYNLRTNKLIPLATQISAGELLWSSDSQWLAFTHSNNQGLFITDIATLTTREILPHEEYSLLAWELDGTRLAFTRQFDEVAELYFWNAVDQTTSAPLRYEVNRITQPVWSPDGKQLAFYLRQEEMVQLVMLDTESTTLQTLFTGTRPPRIEGEVSYTLGEELSWSLDSQWLLFFGTLDEQDKLYLVHKLGGQATPIFDFSGTLAPQDINWIN